MEAGLTRIHSPSSRLGYLLAGLVGSLLTMVLVAWLIAVSFLSLLNRVRDQAASVAAEPAAGAVSSAGAEPLMPWWPVILAFLLFIPLHELVHAIFHPGSGLSPQTVMVIWPTKLRFGVYYEGCMTRWRWLIMRLAPLV